MFVCICLWPTPTAVIRTQPFDLLRWSAAYFRSLALSVQPPVKSRYEPAGHFRQLTTGIVRVLIDQVSMCFHFIHIDSLMKISSMVAYMCTKKCKNSSAS